MQDIEFTIERGKLWMLQTRNGKRTAKAALRIAVDMAAEGLITREEAVGASSPTSLDQLLHPTLDPRRDAQADRARPARLARRGDRRDRLHRRGGRAAEGEGRDVILVRDETSPEDIHGMIAARGILTARGGMTSHAAVVARGMGKPCVCGAGAAARSTPRRGTHDRRRRRSARPATSSPSTAAPARCSPARVPTLQPELTGDFATLMGWADAVRRMKVRANADTPDDARMAREFGAEGIGLCRTEHMFFDGERIVAVREMILADDAAGRRAALAKLLPMQRDDFVELFTIMRGLPVTIRLLDPPLHEFLPHDGGGDRRGGRRR